MSREVASFFSISPSLCRLLRCGSQLGKGFFPPWLRLSSYFLTASLSPTRAFVRRPNPTFCSFASVTSMPRAWPGAGFLVDVSFRCVGALYTATEIPCFHTKKRSKCVKPTRLQKAKEKWSRRRTNAYSLSRSLSRVTYVCTYICTYVLHVVIEIYFYLSQTPLFLSPQVTHASRCYQPFSIDASGPRETITGYNIDLSMSSIIRESSRFHVLYGTVAIVRRKIFFRRDFYPYSDFVYSFWTCTDFARIQFTTTSGCCITTIDRTMPMEFNATRSNDITSIDHF